MCGRKIARHTRSVVPLFRLEFLIAFPTYCLAFFRGTALPHGNYPTVVEKDGTVESKKSNTALKTHPSPSPARRNIYRPGRGRSKSRVEKRRSEIYSQSKEKAGERDIVSTDEFFRGFCISLSVR